MLADMSCAEPAAALGCAPGLDQWGVYEYETDTVKGKAVYCRPFANPPELTLRLSARGWHRIYLGIHYGHTHCSHAAKLGARVVDQTLWLRLTGERAHRLVEPELYGTKGGSYGEWFGFADVTEVQWRAMELSGQDLHLAPRRSPRFPGDAAGLAWVRLERMSEQEVAEHAAPVTEGTARLVYIADTDLHEAYPVSEEATYRLLDPLAGTDFGLVLWTTCMGDVCYYPSGRFPRAFAVEGIESPYGYVPEPRAEGFDVLRTVCEACHDMGSKVHATMRPAASRMPPLHWPRGMGDLFHSCPDVHQRGRSGEPVGHYSFAHPRVRETLTGVLREQVLNYPLDGVHFLFNRGWPYVGYEDHAVTPFIREYGDDPRETEATDPRWLAHKAKYMDEFVGGLRQMLDEAGRQTGRHLALSVTVMAGLEQCAQLGLDVPHWLSQRWLDHLIVHPCWLPDRWLDPHVSSSMSVTPQRVAEVKALAEPTGCRVYADVYPRYMPPTEYPRRALEYYRAGADGLCFWDTYCRVPRASEWSVIQRLGYIEGLEELQTQAERFRTAFRLVGAAGMSMEPSHTPATNG